MKISQINDPDKVLPVKSTVRGLGEYCDAMNTMRNHTIDQYSAIDITGDVERLAQVIANERCTSIEYGREYAKFIIASMPNWLVVRKG